MLNDQFGDHVENDFSDEDQMLSRYHKWLHHMANVYLDASDPRHDDLVQEGRIAMWRALSTYDPSKGALPSWLTTAAKMRMKNMAYGAGQPMGHEPTRNHTEPKQPVSADVLLEDGAEALLGISEALEGVEVSYHQGEIWKAIEALSPSQKRYVIARFWAGVDPSSRTPLQIELRALFPEVSKRYLWNGSSKQVGARDRLAAALHHLATRT